MWTGGFDRFGRFAVGSVFGSTNGIGTSGLSVLLRFIFCNGIDGEVIISVVWLK